MTIQPLIPPDPARCQCESYNARTHTVERCEAVPTVIATERKSGKDGRRGSMSLCEAHLQECVKMFGPDHITTKRIKVKP